MKNKNLAFIDIETTGLSPEKHEIIEIGIVIAKQQDGIVGDVLEEIELKIKPERIDEAEAEALSINGYSEAGWLFAMSLEQAMNVFAEKTKDCIMVAHNVSFDWSFLSRAFYTTGVENKMFYAKLDTISFAFAKFFNDKEITKFNLGFLCEHYGIENNNAHTALSDARATYSLYRKMTEQ
ncbi:MAG: 3'-5' exonuclease [Candidatus Pacebacteria bacterium]|nr:3'-5' exonuclease [Candidatus Paceibacterota bacterium]